MARTFTQGGRRTLVLLSAPHCCAVCSGTRRVRLVALPGLTGGGPMACPHCCNPRLPVVHLPARRDLPRGAA